jgi:hypothetical protein
MKFKVHVTASKPVYQVVEVESETPEQALDLAGGLARAAPDQFEDCDESLQEMFGEIELPDGSIFDGEV